MKGKEKPALTGEQHRKDNNSQRIITTIKGLFLAGRKLTAKEINDITGKNDARKVISDLRRQGWQITDMLLPNRCKLYWLIADNRQLNLWRGKNE
ncbi:MAG: hypothetical protein WCR86_05645 [Parabacteroides sp.]